MNIFEKFLGKDRAPSESADHEKEPPKESHLEWAKGRARSYIEIGKLHEAINSFVSDLRKEDVAVRGPNPLKNSSRPESLGLELEMDPNLDADKVKAYIDSFTD